MVCGGFKRCIKSFWCRLSYPKLVVMPPLRRWLLLPHLALAISGFLAVTIDRENLTSPLYEEILRLPVQGWALFYAAGILAATHAITTASWRTYFITNVVTLGVSLSFLVSILDTRFRDGFSFSLLAAGVWIFPIVHTLVLAILPTRVAEADERGVS